MSLMAVTLLRSHAMALTNSFFIVFLVYMYCFRCKVTIVSRAFVLQLICYVDVLYDAKILRDDSEVKCLILR